MTCVGIVAEEPSVTILKIWCMSGIPRVSVSLTCVVSVVEFVVANAAVPDCVMLSVCVEAAADGCAVGCINVDGVASSWTEFGVCESASWADGCEASS